MARWTKEGNYQRLRWVMGLGCVSLICLVPQIRADSELRQPWKTPGNAKTLRNPIAVTLPGLKAAARLYKQDCVICHGSKGDSNGPAAQSLPQKPANFTDQQLMRRASDGELFWKISTGRAPMPSWQDRLSETERWQLVNYLRMLAIRAQYRYLGTAD
jgi:mono/diheme cytochrome c family protein